MGDEVLQDHLLEVAVLGVHGGQRLEAGHPLLGRLADPHEDPAGERDAQLARRPDRGQAHVRVLGGRALMDHQVGVDRLQHEPLGRGHLAQAPEVVSRERPEVGVGQHPAFERPLAGPGHIGGEVRVPVFAQPLGHHRIDLGLLPGQHEQFLGAAPGRVVEDLLHLLWRVEVRLVGGKGAVLAVAPAGARQRKREVPREGDPPHWPSLGRHARVRVRGAQPTGPGPTSPVLPGWMKM